MKPGHQWIAAHDTCRCRPNFTLQRTLDPSARPLPLPICRLKRRPEKLPTGTTSRNSTSLVVTHRQTPLKPLKQFPSLPLSL